MVGGFGRSANYVMKVKMGASNLVVTCIVTNLVAQGTRAHVKLELDMAEISGIDWIVDGKPGNSGTKAAAPWLDLDRYYGHILQTTLHTNLSNASDDPRSKMITLRCMTRPNQARVRWFYDGQWFLPNATNGRDLTFRATPKDHDKGVQCEATSGREKALSKELKLEFAFDVAVEDVRQHGSDFLITVSGNTDFTVTGTLSKVELQVVHQQ